MPIKVAQGLPMRKELEKERIITMDELRAQTQDIRPLKILILNLMPRKEATELQLLRLLGNTPLQIEVDLMYTTTHQATNTPVSHLKQFYKTFDQVREIQYDGLIITGAPVEHLKYKDVDYINELDAILEWSQSNVFARIHICWGAQYPLYKNYGIEKHHLTNKLFGIFEYRVDQADHPLLRGFNDSYKIPQSRHTYIDFAKLAEIDDLEVLSSHPDYGPDILATKDKRDVFLLGHLEYDRDTLEQEYQRDLAEGKEIDPPENYYPDDDDQERPMFTWRSYAFLFYNNWLNEVYQDTYYDLKDLLKEGKR